MGWDPNLTKPFLFQRVVSIRSLLEASAGRREQEVASKGSAVWWGRGGQLSEVAFAKRNESERFEIWLRLSAPSSLPLSFFSADGTVINNHGGGWMNGQTDRWRALLKTPAVPLGLLGRRITFISSATWVWILLAGRQSKWGCLSSPLGHSLIFFISRRPI